MWVPISWLGRLLRRARAATQCSCSGESPWTEDPTGLRESMGSRLSDLAGRHTGLSCCCELAAYRDVAWREARGGRVPRPYLQATDKLDDLAGGLGLSRL